MKFIKKILIAAVVLAAFALHTDSFARARVTKKTGLAKQVKQTVAPVAEPIEDVEIVVNTEREKIEQAVIDTEKIKTAATLAINDANEQLAQGKMSHVDAAKIIGEQQYAIEQAKRQLAQLAGKSIEKVQDAENQESYLTQLFSGAQAAKAGLLEGIGYSSTAQQKAIAQAVIDELKKQLDSVSTDYAKKIEAASNPQDKAKLLQELDTIKRDIEKEIYRQQTITEDVMSTNKKLFWSAVGLAGAAVGAALAYQYLGTETPGATIEGTTEKETPSAPPVITTPVITTTASQPAITTQISEPQNQMPGTPSAPAVISSVSSTQGQPENSQLPAGNPDVSQTGEPIVTTDKTNEQFPGQPEVEPIPGIIEGEQTEAPSTAQKMIKTAQEAASNIYGKVKGTAGSAYENIKGALGGPETEEEYLKRTGKAKEAIKGSTLFPVQPPTKLSDAEQKALLQQEGEALGEFLLRPNLVPSETGELKISSDVLPEYREGLMQSGGEVLTGAAKTIVDAEREMLTGARKTISDADLITEEDLSGVSLNPAKYQKSVESAGASIAGALGRAAEEQNRQVEEQIPSRLGTGGVEPSEYPGFVKEKAESAARTGEGIARAFEESPSLALQQKQELLPIEFGTGRREIEADKTYQERIKYLEDLIKAEGKYKKENNPELEKLIQEKFLEWEDINNKTSFYNPEETRELYERSREDFENKLRVATQTPEKREQIIRTQEEQKEKIKKARDRKRQTKDEGTQK